MQQIEFPEAKPVLWSGRWGWIVGFCLGTLLLIILQAGFGYPLGALGVVLLLVLTSLFGEAALPQRRLPIAGSERVLTRAERDRLALLPPGISAPEETGEHAEPPLP